MQEMKPFCQMLLLWVILLGAPCSAMPQDGIGSFLEELNVLDPDQNIEDNIRAEAITDNLIMCVGSSPRVSIDRNLVCDGNNDCPQGVDGGYWDETNCNCPGFGEIQDPLNYFQCSNTMCIPISDRCNGVQNCPDNSDEINCPITTKSTMPQTTTTAKTTTRTSTTMATTTKSTLPQTTTTAKTTTTTTSATMVDGGNMKSSESGSDERDSKEDSSQDSKEYSSQDSKEDSSQDSKEDSSQDSKEDSSRDSKEDSSHSLEDLLLDYSVESSSAETDSNESNEISGVKEPTLRVMPCCRILKQLDNPVYVSCKADVKDPGLITDMRWTGPDGQKITNDNGSVITLDNPASPGTMDLYIRKLTMKDFGTYVCTVVLWGDQYKEVSQLSAEIIVDKWTIEEMLYHGLINNITELDSDELVRKHLNETYSTKLASDASSSNESNTSDISAEEKNLLTLNKETEDAQGSQRLQQLEDEMQQLKGHVLELTDTAKKGEQDIKKLQEDVANLTELWSQKIKDLKDDAVIVSEAPGF